MDVFTSNPILSLTADIFDCSFSLNLKSQNYLAAQEAADRISFPTSAVSADIIFLLDETGLSDNEFAMMKTFLINFTKKFSVGPESTQFALQAYNGRTIPHVRNTHRSIGNWLV